MSADGQWYYCLKHGRAEHGPGCPGRHRMGPYATENDAANALEHARERTEQWDAEDEEWREGPARSS
jgi:hypothetical protein